MSVCVHVVFQVVQLVGVGGEVGGDVTVGFDCLIEYLFGTVHPEMLYEMWMMVGLCMALYSPKYI